MFDLESDCRLIEEFMQLNVRFITDSNELPSGLTSSVIEAVPSDVSIKADDGLRYIVFLVSKNALFLAGPYLYEQDTVKANVPYISKQKEISCIKLMQTVLYRYNTGDKNSSNFFEIIEKSVASRRAVQLPAYDYFSVKQRLKEAMLSGPSQIIFDYMQHTFEYNIPNTISDDPLHTRKILSFTFLSVMVKSSIEMGLEVMRAFVINDIYLSLLDKAETIKELDKLLFDAACRLSAELRENKPLRYNKYVRYCLSAVSNNLSKIPSLKSLAEQLKISPEYLSRIFSKEVGKTYSDYVLEFRMVEARRMLLFTEESCSSIAFLTGFSSVNHFSRVFSKYWGMPPSKFRIV